MNLQFIYRVGLIGLIITLGIMLAINIVMESQSLAELSPSLEALAEIAVLSFGAWVLCGGYLWVYYFRRVKSTYNLFVFNLFICSSFLGGIWAHYKFQNK